MPMSNGCSSEARSENIAKLIREGYKPARASAAAYRHQRKHCRCRKHGGPRGGMKCVSKRSR